MKKKTNPKGEGKRREEGPGGARGLAITIVCRTGIKKNIESTHKTQQK